MASNPFPQRDQEGQRHPRGEMGKRAVLKDFARSMRSAPTPAERKLWMLLRARRFSGYKFRRQAI